MQQHSKAAKIPCFREIVYAEPFVMARRLKGLANHMLMESVQRHEHLGRYSFLCAAPAATLRCDQGVVRLNGAVQAQSALQVMQRELDQGQRAHIVGLPPFQGGWAGFVAYEFGRLLEPKAKLPNFTAVTPELLMHRYDTVIAIDHLQERAWIIAETESDADELELRLRTKPASLGEHCVTGFTSNFPRGEYEKAIAATVEDILAGEIFQANITQVLSAPKPSDFDCYALYGQLREKNPATFAALLDFDDVEIVSSSPERLVRCDGRMVQARPIKGTRRRDDDMQRDQELITELQASRKDRAENVMIVDLLRNDLSRVCKPGTVKVPVLCGLESYANVHHLVSVVEGELRDDVAAADLLTAVFPGGSITGAPKIRAMEIVAAREGEARGVYCGSIGYVGFSGHSDFNIAIRTVQVSAGVVRVQGGGGITARSNPAAEYDESLTKVARIMAALQS